MSISKLLTPILFIFSLSLSAQVALELEVISDPNFEDVDLTNLFGDVKVQIEVRNVGTTDAELKWEIAAPDPTCRNDFEQFGCDNNQCYTAAVTSNVNPPGEGPDKPSLLGAGESYIYELHVKHNGLPGCCAVELTFSTVADPNTILASIEVPYTINDPQCEITSTIDYEPIDLEWGPNPISDVLKMDSYYVEYSVEIYNPQGQSVHRSIINGQSEIDMQDYESGSYMVLLTNKTGKLSKLIRVLKL